MGTRTSAERQKRAILAEIKRADNDNGREKQENRATLKGSKQANRNNKRVTVKRAGSDEIISSHIPNNVFVGTNYGSSEPIGPPKIPGVQQFLSNDEVKDIMKHGKDINIYIYTII